MAAELAETSVNKNVSMYALVFAIKFYYMHVNFCVVLLVLLLEAKQPNRIE